MAKTKADNDKQTKPATARPATMTGAVNSGSSGSIESKPKPDLSALHLRRSKREPEDTPDIEPIVDVTAGAIGKVVDLVGNPSRESIRGVTIIDRVQGRLLPQLDVIDKVWDYVLQVASYRHDAKEYAILYKKKVPVLPNLIDEFIYRTAQWQRSVYGTNMKSLMDLAMAEKEAGSEEGMPTEYPSDNY